MRSNANANSSGTSFNGQSVKATSGGLIKSTLGAAVVAGAILTFVWLPAEYGIDPTGVGKKLGLTQMGEIKQQLHAEADADAADASAASTAGSPTAAGADVMGRLDAIDAQLAAIATALNVPSQSSNTPIAANTQGYKVWRNEISYTLKPGQGVEVKLAMNEGAVANFEWSANGAVVNHDTHGDGNGQSISYEKGRSVPEQAGQLVAAFTGNHGWFWRNRTDESVVVTLRTRGDYSELVRP